MANETEFDLAKKVAAGIEDGAPKKLAVRMFASLGYKSVTELAKDLKAMSPEEKRALVDDFNRQGLPTTLE